MTYIVTQVANTRPAGRIQPSTCFIRPGTVFLPSGSAELSLNCSGVATFVQSYNYIRPFEGNLEADVAPSGSEFDTPVLEASKYRRSQNHQQKPRTLESEAAPHMDSQ